MGGLGSATSQVIGFFSSCFIIFLLVFGYFAPAASNYTLQGGGVRFLDTRSAFLEFPISFFCDLWYNYIEIKQKKEDLL